MSRSRIPGSWNCRGRTLIEALVALSLGGVVLTGFIGVLVAALGWTGSLAARSEALEVVRTVWVVLDEELRSGVPERDWRVDGQGVLVLRAFRGVGRICPGSGDPEGWTVAYRGRRDPDPSRDSVLVLGGDGGWRAFALVRSGTGTECDAPASGERILRWSWDQGDAPEPVLARVFERGEYHLSDGALRYRRGDGGRQPLTPERLGVGSAFFAGGSSPSGLAVHLEFPSVPGLAPFGWHVGGMEGGG